jgi:hypothetical protein
MLKDRVQEDTLTAFMRSHKERGHGYSRSCFAGPNDACGPQLAGPEVRGVVDEGWAVQKRLQERGSGQLAPKDEQLWEALESSRARTTVKSCVEIAGWQHRGEAGALEAVLSLQRAWAELGEALGFWKS